MTLLIFKFIAFTTYKVKQEFIKFAAMKTAMKKAQLSIEFIFITGFVLILLAGIVTYSFRQSSSSIGINEASNAVDSIIAASDNVYALGPGSVKYITVTFPGGTSNSSVTGRSVLFHVSLFGETTEFHKRSRANLTGEIPSSRGTYVVSAEALDSGLVRLNYTR